LNKLSWIGKTYRALLPLYPAAARSLDLSGYDLVISLSHAAAKNVRVPPGTPHVCYCFTPMRYVWDQAPHYFPKYALWAALPLIRYMRAWDRKGAEGVTHFVAISHFVAARIRRFYGRRAHVIAPPVRMAEEVRSTLTASERELFRDAPPFFLCAGALVPYKRIEVAVQAFSSLGMPLWIAGSGPEEARLRAMAGPSVRFLGRVSDAVLWECYRRCRALVFPGIEDFGIIPVECLASGRPVIGVDAGGLRDSVAGYRPWRRSNLVSTEACGVFISKKDYGNERALCDAVRTFCRHERQFVPDFARKQASRFSYPHFFEAWAAFAAQVGIAAGSGPTSSSGSRADTVLFGTQGASC
jgi:glycosyltransferase involved in cell wall biosynthesis